MKYRDIIRILRTHDFDLVRTKGSHRNYQAVIGGKRRIVIVSCHSENDDVLPKNLASMIRQSGLPPDTFR